MDENTGSKAQITKLLEEIASELAPSYAGRLSVREYTPVYDRFLPGDEPFLYIAEETEQVRQWETRGFLGLTKKKMQRLEKRFRIIAAVYVFEQEGKNRLGFVLPDDKDQGVFNAYLLRCGDKYNIGPFTFHLMH